MAVKGMEIGRSEPTPRTEILTIFPDMAKEWLKNNKINRQIKKKQVQALARVIALGEWDARNGETIIISTAGDLLDGQHRLTAVVEANLPITTLVVFNVNPDKRGTIDTGYKRTFGDFLTMHGEGSANQLAAACHILYGYEKGSLRADQRGSPFISYDEGLDFLQAHPFLRHAITPAKSFAHLLPTSWGTAFISIMMQKDAKLSEQYVALLCHGDYTLEYPIMKRLRERLIRNTATTAKLPHIQLGAYFVKAWNATRLQTNLRVFKLYPEENFPEVK